MNIATYVKRVIIYTKIILFVIYTNVMWKSVFHANNLTLKNAFNAVMALS